VGSGNAGDELNGLDDSVGHRPGGDRERGAGDDHCGQGIGSLHGANVFIAAVLATARCGSG
jgi:hypothetical protein